MSLLQVEDLRVFLRNGNVSLLDGVSFDLAKGESLGLVGESGCGKSMTALALMGLLPDSLRVEGQVRFQEKNLLELSEKQWCGLRGRHLAMVFQEPMTALNPVKTIGHQIAEGLRLHMKLGRAAAKEKACALLDRVGLPQPRFAPDLFPHQLSGGQRQRVAIAIALACDPDILIADEPTTALDVTLQAQILQLIAELSEERGMSLITITHDLGVVAQTTDRMLVMYAGKVMEEGRTADVFRAMVHPYTRGLFAALPGQTKVETTQGGRRPRLPAIPGMVPDPVDRPRGCAFAPRCHRSSVECESLTLARHDLKQGHQTWCQHPYLPEAKA